MLAIELFGELTVNNTEFNGDINLTDVGVLWSFNFEAPELLEDEEVLIPEEELIEALEEDLDLIKKIFKHYKEDINDLELGEIQIDENLIFVELITVDLD